jgi:undecaprenyl pyrophosphate phosphatase UppP
LLAAPAGLVDWTGIKKEKPPWKIGLYHLALNVVVTALFAINLGLRLQDFRDASIVATAPLTLSILGTAILIASCLFGWTNDLPLRHQRRTNVER